MIVGDLTTFHTQYTSDRSIQLHRWIKKFSKFSFMMRGVQQLCISPPGAQFTKMAANDGPLTVWNELDFRVDVCRITKGAHIEHLYGMSQKHGVLFY